MSIFKQTLSPEIQKQLQARTNVVKGSGSLESTSPGRSQLLPWYLSKNSWVRMTSMVNFTSGKIDFDKFGSGSIETISDGKWTGDQLSKRYILEGGTLYTRTNNGEEIEATLRNNIGSAGGSYGGNFDVNGDGKRDEYSRQFGIRPMPGIESVSLRTVGAYGSIFSTTVKFYAWDTKQLNDLEILFMRPGYSVLLEWGWSQYIDNNNIPKVFQGQTINAFTSLTQQEIYDKLQALRVKYNHNYDGMLGYVKNFSWKMMRNGGYECTTELISMGEVINTLKISTNNLNVNKDKPDFDFDKKTNYVYDDYENLLISLKAASEGIKKEGTGSFTIFEDEYKGKWDFDKNYIERGSVITKLRNNGYDVIADSLLKQPINKKINTGDENNPEGQYYEYLSLDVVMAIMDSYFNIVVTSEKSRNTTDNIQKSVKIIPPGIDDYCLAGKDSISVDPSVCLVGNTLAFQEEFTFGFNPVITKPDEKLGVVIPVTQTVIENNKYVRSSEIYTLNKFYEEEINAARIANINVNINLLLNEYKSLKNSANDDGVNFMAYMKNVLNRISNALGGLNNFILSTAGRDQNTLRIVDTYYLEQKSDKYEFDLIGLGSICREVDIESQIFPEQSTIVAIAAQSRANLGDIYNSTQVYLNAGIEDRVALVKEPPGEIENEKNKGNPNNPFYQKLFNFLLYVRDNIVGTPVNTTSQLGDSVNDFSISTDNSGTVPSTFLKQFMLKYNGELNFKALIPFKLTIKLDGIGGIIVGEIFKVKQNVLPRNYYDKNLGFIITEIQHNLVRNDWETTLTTQICLLDNIELGKKYNNITRQGFQNFLALGIKDSLYVPALINFIEYIALKTFIILVKYSYEKSPGRNPIEVAYGLLNQTGVDRTSFDSETKKEIDNYIKEYLATDLTDNGSKANELYSSSKQVNYFRIMNFKEYFKFWVETKERRSSPETLNTRINENETYIQALKSLIDSEQITEISNNISNNIDMFTSFNNIENGIWFNSIDKEINGDPLKSNIRNVLVKRNILSQSTLTNYDKILTVDKIRQSSFNPIDNFTKNLVAQTFNVKRIPTNQNFKFNYRLIAEENVMKNWILSLSETRIDESRYNLTGLLEKISN